jgi:O-antigen/teichoic acid export membrane protein
MSRTLNGVTGENKETPNQRLTRNISELLSELRVAQAGVQILFGFLLSVVFTAQFREASGFEKGLHLTAVILAAISTALLTAPAAWHRVLFRGGRRYEIIETGNRAVLVGLACLASAITVTVGLIVKVVYGPIAMATVGGLVGIAFALLWFFVPRLISRR